MATIRKRILPSGETRWQVDYRDNQGKRRSKQFERKKEAEAYETKVRAELASGVYVHAAGTLTVEKAAELYIQHIRTRRDAGQEMERATCRDYESKINLHILDPEHGIGATKLSNLNPKAVGAFRDRLLSSGRSVPMTRRILATLGFILSYARENGLVATNAAQGVTVRRTSRAGNKVTKDMIKRLKADVKALIGAADDTFRPYLLVAALAGLRASEQRGLVWANVDLDSGYIHVRQRADTFNEIGEPKSEAGHRSVPIGPALVTELKKWKLRCPPSKLGLVFPNRRGGVRAQVDVHRLWFKPACKKLGTAMRWHDLRHFAISTWIEQGFDVRAVMEFAGHSDYRMTMERYGHLFPSPEHHKRMGAIERALMA